MAKNVASIVQPVFGRCVSGQPALDPSSSIALAASALTGAGRQACPACGAVAMISLSKHEIDALQIECIVRHVLAHHHRASCHIGLSYSARVRL